MKLRTVVSAVILTAILPFLSKAQTQDVHLVYYIDANKGVDELRCCFSTWRNTFVTTLTGAPAAAGSTVWGGPYNYSSEDKVWYIGSDQHIHELSFSSVWSTSDVTVSAGTVNPIAGSALTSIANGIDIWLYFIGPNSHVYQLLFNGSSWTASDVTALAGGPNVGAGSGLATLYWRTSNEVYYVTTSQHIEELYFNGTSWNKVDVTAVTGAPNAATGSALSSLIWGTSPSDMPEVYYITTSQHLEALYYNGSWNARDLTATTGAPNAATGTALTSFVWQSNPPPTLLLIYYIATNEHVEEVYYNGSGTSGWHAGDVTALAGAPNSSAGNAVSGNAFSSSEVDIYFVAPNEHVHDLVFVNGSGWKDEDVTNIAGGPLVATASQLKSFLGY